MTTKRRVRELNEDQRARLDAEWAFINATREGMNIARRKPDQTTYNQAIHLGEVIAPGLMDPHRRLIPGDRESQEAKFFREQAVAESGVRGHVVTALEMCEEAIEKLERQTGIAPEAESLQNRLDLYIKVRQELKPKRYTENQIIFRDAIKTNHYLPISKDGTEYTEYIVDENRNLRIAVLHPDPPEHKIGADLIYEIHNAEEQTVRVALLQYKMWDRRRLPHDPRMADQIDRLMGASCRGQLCLSPEGDQTQRTFRFPFCAAFLRPTDRLQDPDATLISSGLHVPLCVSQQSWRDTGRGGKALDRSAIAGQSVSHAIFEYLFVCSHLGSRELEWDILEKYYRNWGILEREETIILHMQEYRDRDRQRPRRRTRQISLDENQ